MASLLDGLSGLSAETVLARSIPEGLREVGGHALKHSFIHRRGGLIIQINVPRSQLVS